MPRERVPRRKIREILRLVWSCQSAWNAEIVNTDQSSQFTAHEFVQAVKDRGCKVSMDGRGAWRDNVFVERLWKSVKYERVYLHAYDSVTEARRSIMQYMSGTTDPGRIRAWAKIHLMRLTP